MTRYAGKTLFLEEQPDGRYTLYSWYHAPLATEELEALMPIIRAWQPPVNRRTPNPMPQLELDLSDLLGEDND